MTQCASIQDARGVRCNQGAHHKTYELHIWQGETEHGPDTVVVWSDKESRAHMNAERDFFAHAERLAVEDGWPGGSYQEVVKGLLQRLKAKK